MTPPYLQVLHLQIQPTTNKKYLKKEKTQESCKKQNFNLSRAGNYLHSIYIVLGITNSQDDLIQEDASRLYANTSILYEKFEHLRILVPEVWGWFLEPIHLWILKDDHTCLITK